MKKECALLQLEGTMEKNLKMKIFNYYRRISMCLEFMSYSLIVNSEKVRPIVLGHGLRQGNPLSPYLVILCTKGLLTLIKSLEVRGCIHGVKIYISALSIYHLLFRDDCFLFFKANDEECLKLKSILEDFVLHDSILFFRANNEEWQRLGQSINFQKSEVLFNRNTSIVFT